MIKRRLKDIISSIQNTYQPDTVECFYRICFVERSGSSGKIKGVEARTSVRYQKGLQEWSMVSGGWVPSEGFIMAVLKLVNPTEIIIPICNNVREGSFTGDKQQHSRGNIQIYFREAVHNSYGVDLFSEGYTSMFEKDNMLFSNMPQLLNISGSGEGIILPPYLLTRLMKADFLDVIKKRIPVNQFHHFYSGTGCDDLSNYRGFRNLLVRNSVVSLNVKKTENTKGTLVDNMIYNMNYLHFFNHGTKVCSLKTDMIKSFERVSKYYLFEHEGYIFSLPFLKINGSFQWE